MERREDVILFKDANNDAYVLPGASITVYVAGTSTPATLYSDDGVTEISNPVTADSAGRYFYYTADGTYDEKIEKTGYTTQWRYGVYLSSNSQPAEISVDITGLSTLDLTSYPDVSIVNLTSSNSSESISSIVGILVDGSPTEIRPSASLTVTFIATVTPLTGTGQIALFSSTKSCNGSKGESLTVRARSGYYGVYQVY